MILHICTLEKFIPPFIELVSQEFDPKQHHFLLYGDKQRFPFKPNENIEYKKYFIAFRRNFFESLKNIFRFIFLIHISKKIILHGLFDINIVKLLAFIPYNLKKCYWVMWGGDLYHFKFRNKSLLSNVNEFFRRIVIKRIGHFVTYMYGDYELARKWYKASGKLHECFMYTSNLYKGAIFAPKKADRSTINILVGNSADPSNNHIEIFKLLMPYCHDNIKIYVPLSYGNQEYAKEVITTGEIIFGNKFEAITSFMPIEDYNVLLADIDIAVFNHKRQQALGNIITLLGMGKRVFIRDDIVTYDFFKNLCILVYKIQDFNFNCLHTSMAKNSDIISREFSRKRLIQDLKNIFS